MAKGASRRDQALKTFGAAVRATADCGSILVAERKFEPGDKIVAELWLYKSAPEGQSEVPFDARPRPNTERRHALQVPQNLDLAIQIASDTTLASDRALALFHPPVDQWPAALALRKALPRLVSRGTVSAAIDIEKLLQAFCVVEVNARLLTSQELALFDTASRANHSCHPNAIHTSQKGHIVCVKEIQVGEEICVTYLDYEELLLPTRIRRVRLQESWGFACHCERCTEAEERGEATQAFRCGHRSCQGKRIPSIQEHGMVLQPCELCGRKSEESPANLEAEQALTAELAALAEGSTLDLAMAWQPQDAQAALEACDAAGLHSDHWLVSGLHMVLAIMGLHRMPNPEVAADHLRQRIMSIKSFFPDSLVYAEACCWEYLGDAYMMQEASAEAEPCYESSWRITSMMMGDDDENAKEVRAKLLAARSAGASRGQ